jgi:hypothetical protein
MKAAPTLLEGKSAALSVDTRNPARCASCSCSDREACLGGCHWLAVNRARGSGICSNCPGKLQQWRNQQVTA